MECPGSHEWYELARGAASREDADRLRRHRAECPECRARADEMSDMAAHLESLADRTRVDVPEAAAESILRRAKCHGLLGRPPRRSWLAPFRDPHSRLHRLRYAIPLSAAAAAMVLLAILIQPSPPTVVPPLGSLDKLVRGAAKASRAEDLKVLAPVARAAVAEELARAKPKLDQVADLALVAYITECARDARQVEDVRFLTDGVQQKREMAAGPLPARAFPVAMLATVGASPADLPRSGAAADAFVAARLHVLHGDYKKALEAMPADPSARLLKAWCLQELRRPAEAGAELLPEGLRPDHAAIARVLRADLALAGGNVAEALREYETLAGTQDRFWFGAGYLCRYELGDLQGAGQRFEYVKDPRLAGYVATAFKPELEAASRGAAPMFSEDFESYVAGGTPSSWRLVKMRGDEVTIVKTPSGQALQADEFNGPGSELLAGTADFADYTLQMDVKIVETGGDYVVGAALCRRGCTDPTGYVLELAPDRLRLVKQFPGDARKDGGGFQRMLIEAPRAQARLAESPVIGWWYTLKVRVQRVGDDTVSLAGKVWRSDTEEPIAWQVIWTDTGLGGFEANGTGYAGIQVRGAKALVDNMIVTKNELPGANVAARKK